MSTAWLQRYRLLVVVYGMALLVGAREYFLSRHQGSLGGTTGCEASAASCFSISARTVSVDDSVFWSRHAELVEILERVNPGDPDTEFLKGMQSLADGDQEEFVRRVEAAVTAGVKHNYFLLQYYAQYLLDRGADFQLVNRAVNRWRENHPFSAETLSLQLGTGPSTPSDEAALQGALARVPWIAGARLEPGVEDGQERWQVLLAFRPGRTVDMREAMAAVTVLSIPPEQRPFYEVTCQTLVACTARRRAR